MCFRQSDELQMSRVDRPVLELQIRNTPATRWFISARLSRARRQPAQHARTIWQTYALGLRAHSIRSLRGPMDSGPHRRAADDRRSRSHAAVRAGDHRPWMRPHRQHPRQLGFGFFAGDSESLACGFGRFGCDHRFGRSDARQGWVSSWTGK